MIEKIIFNLLAIVLFLIIFVLMARKNDTNYVIILIAEAIGIAINFVELNFNILENGFLKALEYILAIILPICLLIAEYKKIKFAEIVSFIKVKYYYYTNNNEKARKVLVQLVTKYSDSYIGRNMLAKTYEKQGNYEDAITEYYRTMSIKQNDLNINYKIAELLIKTQRNDEAESTLINVLKQKPDFYEASNLLGDLLYNEQRYKEAINVYTDALIYKPEDFNLYYNLGMVYVGLNDFQNANICYKRAAELNSKLYNAYYTLGQLSLIANDIDEAERYFAESLYDEIEADSYYELSRIYMLRNEKEKAITFIEKAIEKDIKYLTISKKDPLFIPIKQYLVEPTEIKQPEQKFTEKEQFVRRKLRKTIAIVEKIGFKQMEENIENSIEQHNEIENEIQRDI